MSAKNAKAAFRTESSSDHTDRLLSGGPRSHRTTTRFLRHFDAVLQSLFGTVWRMGQSKVQSPSSTTHVKLKLLEKQERLLFLAMLSDMHIMDLHHFTSSSVIKNS